MPNDKSHMQRRQARSNIRTSPGESSAQADASHVLGREYMHGLVEALPQPAAVFDRNGRFVAMNSICMRLLGHEGIKEFMGATYKEVLHPDLYEGPGKAFAQAVLAGRPLQYEAECQGRHYDIQLAPLKDKQGKPRFILAFAMDVTEKVRLQNQLARREQFFREIVQDQSDYIFRATHDYVITFVNDAFAKASGRRPQDICGTSLLEGFSESEVARALRAVSFLGPACPSFSLSWQAEMPDGFSKWSEWTIRGLLDDDGRLREIQGVGHDVTSLRRLHQELAGREQFFRDIVEQQTEYVCRALPDTTLTFVNAACARLTGLLQRELVGARFLDFTPEEDRADLLASLRALSPQCPALLVEHRTRLPDGRLCWHQWNNLGLFDEHGSLTEILSVGRDITERKQAEEALRQSEERYRSIFENSLVGIFQTTPDGRILSANPALARMAGYDSPREFMDSFEDIGTQLFTDPGRRMLLLERILEHGSVTGFEARFFRKDRSIVWISLNVRAILGDDGSIRYLEGTALDITARTEAEEALRRMTEEKERYRRDLDAIFQGLPDALISVDSTMRVAKANKCFHELCDPQCTLRTGMIFSEAPGFRGSCPCGDLLGQVLVLKRAMHDRQVVCRRAGRPERVVRVDCLPILDTDNSFDGALLIIRDITRLASLEKRLAERSRYHGIIGRSKPMQGIYGLLEQMAPVDSTVLVTGESGTGKELIAEALHYRGSRAGGPLIKVNCTALPENLLESELFGHVRGAFTGATQARLGRFQTASGGTIFLDEIGDVSPALQAKLLRVLEHKEFERVGDSGTIKANVRIVAATNADLVEKVARGEFREDLYYRLRVMRIHMPPLRERLEDIPLLVDHFIAHFNESFGKSIKGISEEVLQLLLRYNWPGNVRELKHAVEHACILCRDSCMAPEHLPEELMGGPDMAQTSAADHPPLSIEEALARSGGNKALAARLLGVSRQTLYRKLKGVASGKTPM